MQPMKAPLHPAVPAKTTPATPHSGEGSNSALEALKRALRDKPAGSEPRRTR